MKSFYPFFILLVFLSTSAFAQPFTVNIVGPDTVCLYSNSENPPYILGQVQGGSGSYAVSWTYFNNGQPVVASRTRLDFQPVLYSAGQYMYIFQGQDRVQGITINDTIHLVVIDQGCDSVKTSLSATPDSQCVNGQVFLQSRFHNVAPLRSGSSYYSTWDMGDGDTLPNRGWGLHQYQQTGTYTIQYCVHDTIRNQSHCSSQQVVIDSTCRISGHIEGLDSLCYVQYFNDDAYFELQLDNPYYYQRGTFEWFIDSASIAPDPNYPQYMGYAFPGFGNYTISCIYRDTTTGDSAVFTKILHAVPDSFCNWDQKVCIVGPDTICQSQLFTTGIFCLDAQVKDSGQFYSFWWTGPGGFAANGNRICVSYPHEYILVATNQLTGEKIVVKKNIIISNRGTCPYVPPALTFIDSQCIHRDLLISDGINLNEGYKHSWDMGDGATYQDTSYVRHRYSQPGTYVINLTFIDTVTADTTHLTDSVRITNRCWPSIRLDSFENPGIICPGTGRIFRVATTAPRNTNLLVEWDMGDSTVYSFTDNLYQLPPLFFTRFHRYTKAGTYPIRLTVIDTTHHDTVTLTDTVHVDPHCWPKVSADSLDISPLLACPNQNIQFQGYSSGGLNRWNISTYWDLGDGTIVQGDTGTHTYLQGGVYAVEYCIVDTITDDTSCLSNTVQILNTCSDSLSGYLFHDRNQNGTFDANETPLSGYPVIINPGGNLAFSNALGYYEMALAPGVYTFNAPQIPYFGVSSPASGSYTDTLNGSFVNKNRDFGYDSLIGNHDLEVRLYCSRARPGFDHSIYAHFKNKGASTVSGNIQLHYDPQTRFKMSTPFGQGVHDSVNHTITWTFHNLLPGNVTQTKAGHFTLPASVPLGTNLNIYADIGPTVGDIDSTNNSDTCLLTVTGAFDPNDKLVDQPRLIRGDEWLTYTIRFQNTGTDTAFTVVLRDTLDEQLDLNTFQMLTASHQYRLTIDSAREAVWNFPNILLPDSNTNEPLSHGFVQYRMRLRDSLPEGSQVENFADIYFDFNAPIRTNTTVNVIDRTVGIISNKQSDILIYPNPTTGLIKIESQNTENQVLEASLFDTQGRVLMSKKSRSSRFHMDLSGLSAGVYFLKIQDESGACFYSRLTKL